MSRCRRPVRLASAVGLRRAGMPLGLLALLHLMGCKAGGNAERLEIISGIAPSATCEWLATNDQVDAGFYDPAVDNASGYLLGLAFRNNMQAASSDQLTYGEVASVNSVAHDVQIIGADGCWYLADRSDLPPGAYNQDSHLVDCTKIPAQSANFAVSGTAGEGAGMGAATLRVMSLADMRTMFGSAFSPNDIPPRGAFVSSSPVDNPSVAGINQTTSTLLAYDFGPPSPYDTGTRSAAWGNFPDTYQTQVVVQVRLRAMLQDNTTFVTNYFPYPINICPRCLRGMCGELVQQTCAKGPCGDGSPCLADGTCSNTALTCSALTMFSGKTPDFLTGTCLPAQNFGATTAPQCIGVGCQATQ